MYLGRHCVIKRKDKEKTHHFNTLITVVGWQATPPRATHPAPVPGTARYSTLSPCLSLKSPPICSPRSSSEEQHPSLLDQSILFFIHPPPITFLNFPSIIFLVSRQKALSLQFTLRLCSLQLRFCPIIRHQFQRLRLTLARKTATPP